jgi:hypothetical protein
LEREADWTLSWTVLLGFMGGEGVWVTISGVDEEEEKREGRCELAASGRVACDIEALEAVDIRRG